jgi:hypothetical protein
MINFNGEVIDKMFQTLATAKKVLPFNYCPQTAA